MLATNKKGMLATIGDSAPDVKSEIVRQTCRPCRSSRTLTINDHCLKHRLYVGGIGSGLLAVGVGYVEITDPKGNERVLKSVLHVPKLKCGLMALNTLALLGWTSVITKDGCTMSEGNFRIYNKIRNDLCVWSQTPNTRSQTPNAWSQTPDMWSQTPRVPTGRANVNALFAGVTPKKLSLTDWHERLGH